MKGPDRTKSDWNDYREPNFVPGPDEAHFFTGADPCWSPARESPATPEADPHCPKCGGDGTTAADGSHLPGAIEPGSMAYCAYCRRWGRSARLTEALVAEYSARGTIEPELRLSDPPPKGEVSRETLAEFGPAARTARFVSTPDGLARQSP